MSDAIPTCPGCGNQIDPDTCCCGEPIRKGYHDNHSPVPMGCDCLREKREPVPIDWKKQMADFRENQRTAQALSIIQFLNGRKGFNHWWDDIRESDQNKIIQEIANLL